MRMLNMDFSTPLAIDTNQMDWEASPMSGVWRKPLARAAAEHGHTTSVVRYDAGSSFSPHEHPLGEEILVLHGVFSDEHGDYPVGTYIRNPPGSRHSPRSDPGCVLLVKLDQFDPEDDTSRRIDTRIHSWLDAGDDAQIMLLHAFGSESVALLKWPAHPHQRCLDSVGGEEIFVLSGQLCDDNGCYPAGTWIRRLHCEKSGFLVQDEALLWTKTGHLLP